MSVANEGVHDWWSEGDSGVQAGIRYYDHYVASRNEERIDRRFEEASKAVQARPRPFLTLDELLVVMDFKNSPGRRDRAHAAAHAQKDKIEDVTRQAIAWATEDSESAELKAVSALRGLDWVGVPTASAILAMALPGRFGVIDRLIMGEIGRLARGRLVRAGEARSAALVTLTDALILWAEGSEPKSLVRYARGLRQRCAELSLSSTPRTIDKALWGWAEERRRRSV